MTLESRQGTGKTELNMTPMIDITFQLILFFLLNLRFKSLDWRIESRMPPVGMDVGPPVIPLPNVRVSLVRLDADDEATARTRVKIGGSEWILPDRSRLTPAERDARVREIQDHLRAIREGSTLAVRGQIDAPPPKGALVPHGDVVAMLDAFVGAGYHDVDFVGAAMPLPRRR